MSTPEQLCNEFFKLDLTKDRGDVDCLMRSLRQFCKTGKKSDAFCVYYCFCELFSVFGSGYDSTNRLLEFLSDHEFHSGELLTKHRDHYSHSVYVFALGLAIYANDEVYRTAFRKFYKAENADDTDFLHWWGLAALFHDIGYPFQLAHEQIKSYASSMWGNDVQNYPYVSYENMDKLLALDENVKSKSVFAAAQTVGELLACGINYRLGYPKDILLPLLSDRYRNQPYFMDHGYFSAVLLLNQLNGTNIAIDNPVLDVLTAIALHNNLNRYDIKARIKADIAVPMDKHPIAYLLILCDELQDWNRTAFGYVSKKDPLAWKVELDISAGKINICYVFDSYRVVDSQPNAAVVEARGVSENIFGIMRNNSNYNNKASGKFASDIRELVSGKMELTVTTREEKKIKNTKAASSSDSFVNLCDFARAIHLSFQSAYGAPDFNDMPLEFRLSNIEQAKSYADKLDMINCFYSEKELDYPIVTGFVNCGESADESEYGVLNFLAREEHLRWVREKLAAGWKYGTDYKTSAERNAKKIHKDIIPFDLLPEVEKSKDELMIRNMVPLLYHYGHGVRIYRYPDAKKPVLNIMGCGHRHISGNTDEIKAQVKDVLRAYQESYTVVVRTAFASGADQLIAECALELDIAVKAVLPMPYEQYIESVRENEKKQGRVFTDEAELRMRHLLAQAVTYKVVTDKDYTYAECAKFMLAKSKKLMALWDGVELPLADGDGKPINRGGTWHTICMAKQLCGMYDDDIHIIKCRR